MNLYLVRHAVAVEHGTPGLLDDDRPLVKKGRARMAEVAAAFLKAAVPVDRILSSPLVRAVQTAEILAWALAFKGEVEVTRHLAGGTPQDIDRILGGIRECEGLALVGHEPGMSELAGHYLGMTDFPEFRKGAICALELPKVLGRKPGRFIGMLDPKSLEWTRKIVDVT